VSSLGESSGATQPSWKTTQRASGRRRTAAPRWRRGGDSPTTGPVTRRSLAVRAALTVAAAAALVVAFVWVVLWLRPLRPAALVLAGAGYQENLAIPHNAYGLNGLKALAASRAAVIGPVTLTNASQLTGELGRSPARTNLVFLALHGASDERGAFLFLDQARPESPPERLYLKELIDQVKVIRSKRFVLVLDATQAPAMPTLGIVHNDFAEKLKALKPEIEAATNLVVISASDVDQRSWISDRWRRSVFAHYLIEGLAGAAADPAARRINAANLWEYVTSRVSGWSTENRGASQTPVIYPDANRARSFELALAARAGPAASPPALLPEPAREAAIKAWDEYHALVRETAGPAPAVYTPALWRQYRDWLIRHDQLLRAGDKAAADAVRARLDGLLTRLKGGRTRELGSERNSLALTAARGLPLPDATDFRARFNTLWTDPNAAKEMKLAKSPPDELRVYSELLIDRVASDPSAESLTTAARLLPDLAASDRRPIELHFLAMLARDAPHDPVDPAAYRPLVTRALTLRTLAERVAIGARVGGPAYAEHVGPWVSSTVREADGFRRRGEDLVFANDLENWKAARKLLDDAERLYQQAGADAGTVREAVETCDDALADLPYYANWAADLPPSADPATDPIAAVRALFEKAHALARRLLPGAPKPGDSRTFSDQPGGRPRDDLKTLATDANELKQGMENLRRTFLAACEGADGGYLATAAAVETPFTEWKTRDELLKRLVALSPGSETDASPSQGAKLSRGAASAEILARRRGLLDLSSLGRSWFDEAATVPELKSETAGDEPDQAKAKAKALRFKSYADVESLLSAGAASSKTLDEAGEQIGARWRKLPLAIRQWTEDVSLSPPGSLHPNLEKADRLGRLLPASLAGPSEPASVYRNKLLQELLFTQARRALDDHWFGDDDGPDSVPFYRAAGQVFLDDAKALDPRKELRSDAIDALKGALGRVERLEVVGPEPLAVTSEQRSRVSYRLRIPAGSRVPEGHPVVWLAAEPAGLFKSDPPAEGRQAPEVVGLAAEEARQDPAKTAPAAKVHARLDFPLTDRVENDPASFRRPEPRKSAVVLNGVYRGQTLRWETPVTFHPVPEITSVNYPLPTTGKVAVSADAALIRRHGEAGGAVAIVLDCSGSMSAVTARGSDGASARTKYQEATDALREVLAKVGRGTTVSLWVFGEELGPNDTADQAERTILQVLPPTPWRPDDPALLADVMGRVESPKLIPWNESPIVRAMLLARDDLREASGFKTLLVLTDGKDNRFEKDAEINRAKKDIPTAIRDAFSASDIEINVVGYKVADAEEVEAKK
jgi:hypothetical protein